MSKKLDNKLKETLELVKSIADLSPIVGSDVEHYEVKFSYEIKKKQGGTFARSIDVINGKARKK